MIDSGANINIITYESFTILQSRYKYKHCIYQISKNIDTATEKATLKSIGKMYIGGVVGTAEI